jgi:DNA gyrase/topoisomerase IV subunit A
MLKREHIPIGRENAITRDQLSRLTGLNDRKLRKEIARLRCDDDETNIVIVSTSDGRGYYRTDNIDEIEHFIREMVHRISSIVAAIKVAKLAVRRLRDKEKYGGGLV